MSEQPPIGESTEAPVDPMFTHAASPFLQTHAPAPVAYSAFSSPPSTPPHVSTWISRRAEIEFALAVLAYLMVLVGVVVAIQANPTARWRYDLLALPLLPGGMAVWLFVRAIDRLNDLQKRIQVRASGFALGGTALMTFGYGFLEGSGMPHLNWVILLPIEMLMWGVGTLIFTLRYR
ncbi:MAG: hypothetical protein ACHQ0J_06845 [Candidatus Dormibacterales bacterium]